MDASPSSTTGMNLSPRTYRETAAKTKACLQCTKSKRRCDKSSPQCWRCLDKGVACQYPPPRHRSRQQHAITTSDPNQTRESSGRLRPVPRQVNVSSKLPAPTFSRRISPVQTPGLAHTTLSSSSSEPEDSLANDRWFLTPDTFVKRHEAPSIRPQQPLCYQDRVLGDETIEFLQATQSWMEQWARTGHSPAVHQHLYSGGYMPQCVEDAFTVLATYHSSTNRQIRKTALQIADRRASRLIASFDEFRQDLYPDVCDAVVIDTRTHLGRTLALLTYQIIGLFDTDIRARSNAEDYIDTLNRWAAQMLESARLDCLTAEADTGGTSFNLSGCVQNHHPGPETPSLSFDILGDTTNPVSTFTFDHFDTIPLSSNGGDPLLPPHADATTNTDQSTGTASPTTCGSKLIIENPFITASKKTPSPSENQSANAIVAEHDRVTSLWRAWLVAESVRRIYITAVYMQCVYMTLKRGMGGAACPGGMAFTARRGLWDAQSAYTWFNLVRAAADQHDNSRSSSLLMVNTNDMWTVVDEATPKDVDEFTHAMLLICFGKEWIMEQWLGKDEAVEGT